MCVLKLAVVCAGVFTSQIIYQKSYYQSIYYGLVTISIGLCWGIVIFIPTDIFISGIIAVFLSKYRQWACVYFNTSTNLCWDIDIIKSAKSNSGL